MNHSLFKNDVNNDSNNNNPRMIYYCGMMDEINVSNEELYWRYIIHDNEKSKYPILLEPNLENWSNGFKVSIMHFLL